MKRMVLMSMICLLMGACIVGCETGVFGKANPRTEIRYGATGISVYNSKDVAVSLDELDVDPASKVAKIKGLKITDEASSVRRADAIQSLALVQQQQAFNQGMGIAFAGVRDIFGLVGGGGGNGGADTTVNNPARMPTIQEILAGFQKLESNLQQLQSAVQTLTSRPG